MENLDPYSDIEGTRIDWEELARSVRESNERTGRFNTIITAHTPTEDSYAARITREFGIEPPRFMRQTFNFRPVTASGEIATGKIIFNEFDSSYKLVSKRPTQETLDELYDLFGWYYVDIQQ